MRERGLAAPVLRAAASGAIIVGIPLLLVSAAVRGVALSEDFYLHEFERYRVDRTTGLAPAQLRDTARGFIAYFQEPPGPLSVNLRSGDEIRPLFSEREIAHMEDVQGIMHRVLGAWAWGSAEILLGGAALVLMGRGGVRRVVRATAAGGATAVLLVGALSVGALADFRELFLRFHLLSFANDLWVLDPARDRLIQLFPQGFFLDAALRIGVQTITLGASICVLSLVVLGRTGKGQPVTRSS